MLGIKVILYRGRSFSSSLFLGEGEKAGSKLGKRARPKINLPICDWVGDQGDDLFDAKNIDFGAQGYEREENSFGRESRKWSRLVATGISDMKQWSFFGNTLGTIPAIWSKQLGSLGLSSPLILILMRLIKAYFSSPPCQNYVHTFKTLSPLRIYFER